MKRIKIIFKSIILTGLLLINAHSIANKATAMLHGEVAAQNSEQAAKEAFSGNSLGSNLPSVKIETKQLENNFNIIDLIILSKAEKSKSEIKRLIKGKAIKINDAVVSEIGRASCRERV